MDCGIGEGKVILRVGFLNKLPKDQFDHSFEDQLKAYIRAYDIVLVDDLTMEVPRKMVGHIIDKA